MEKHVLCYQYYSFIAKKTLTYLLTFSFLCRIQEFEYVFSSPCLICGKFQFQSMILTAQSMILTALMVCNMYAHCMYTLHVLQYTLNVNVALQKFKLNVCILYVFSKNVCSTNLYIRSQGSVLRLKKRMEQRVFLNVKIKAT